MLVDLDATSNFMNYDYVGPSWAAQSFDAPGIPITNLALEWNIPFRDYSKRGATVPELVKSCINSDLPIIWIYSEPTSVLTSVTGLSLEEFLQRNDWKDIREECNQYCLNLINKMNRPVLLVGASSDIVNCNYSNITIGHPSWQKWIAKTVGMTFDGDSVIVSPGDGSRFLINYCWGAELTHKYMHDHPNIKPAQSLVDSIWDVFFFWKELEKKDYFFDVHPNRKCNIEFAKILKPTVEKFLQDTINA